MDQDGFDWKQYLSHWDIKAANVSQMKHAPGYDVWRDAVTPGIKLVILHSDIPQLKKTRQRRTMSSSRSSGFWVVTVERILGYYALVRYVGSRDHSNDFWIHLGEKTVFPVGAEPRNCVLIPPQCVHGKVSEWRTHLVRKLIGAKTLPLDFQTLLNCGINSCKFKVGEYLEVVDKYKISQFRIGRVIKITGRRISLRYIDDSNDGFTCHEESSVAHLLGWAETVGHELYIPHGCKSKFFQLPSSPLIKQENGHDHPSEDSAVKGANVDDANKIKSEPINFQSKPMPWSNIKAGMKLEAVDPLCPGRICAATVWKVLGFGNMMVKMDSYDDGKDAGANSFCYHINSPLILNCGFCKSHEIDLVPPSGCEIGSFDWNQYLDKTNTCPAPIPEKPVLNHGFEVGMKVEMADVMNPTNIHVATIVQVAGQLLRISFDGWEPEFDQWIDAKSPDIYPIGWCFLVGHKLEPIQKPQ